MAVSHLLIILTLFCRRILGETLRNPQNETEYHCGINEDCTIICDDAFFSCSHSTFYVYNHDINIQCSGTNCGTFSTFISKNATSITINATAENSLWFAEVIVDSPHTNVYTYCTFEGDVILGEACRWTSFYYRTQETVTHICTGDGGCNGAQIHAMGPIELQCHGSQNACNHLAVIWPIDAAAMQKSKMIHYVNHNDVTMYLYLANTQIAPNITCIEGCHSFEIAIIYGVKFDQMCLFNALCIDEILSYEQSFDVSLFNNDFYPSYRNGDYIFSQNTILSIHRYDSSWNGGVANHSALPTYINFVSDNDAFVSILCTECNEMTLNFSSISNSAITAVDNAQFFIVDGPRNSITTNIVYGSATIYNVKYYLQNTESVTFHGLPKLYPGECGAYDTFCGSEIFLSNQKDVNIEGFLRKEDHCCLGDNEAVTVFSDVGSSVGALENYGWNIQCHINDTEDCVKFKLYFPTLNPTLMPTLYPTLTTNNPSQTVMHSPTLFPSLTPSIAPIADGKVVEHYTTMVNGDEDRDTIVVVKKSSALYAIIWILVGALIIVIIAFVVYVFKNKKSNGKHRKKSTGIEMGDSKPDPVTKRSAVNASAELQAQAVPLSTTVGEEDNVVPVDDEEDGEDDDEDDDDEDPDLELLYNRVVSTKS